MTEKLKPIKMIHLGISAGVIGAYIIFGDLSLLVKMKFPRIDSTSLIYLIIPAISIYFSHFLYKYQAKKTDQNLELEAKIPSYQTATILRLVVLEVAALLILFLKPDFLIFGILIVLYILFLRPTEFQFKRDFNTFG